MIFLTHFQLPPTKNLRTLIFKFKIFVCNSSTHIFLFSKTKNRKIEMNIIKSQNLFKSIHNQRIISRCFFHSKINSVDLFSIEKCKNASFVSNRTILTLQNRKHKQARTVQFKTYTSLTNNNNNSNIGILICLEILFFFFLLIVNIFFRAT